MSWRVLFGFLVLVMAGSAMGGVALGNWFVDQAPRVTAEARTNTGARLEIIRDAAGRELASRAPQPLINGTMGVPPLPVSQDWQIQGISLFDTDLDPMVTLARGDAPLPVSDALGDAGQGSRDVGNIDATTGRVLGSPTDPEWRGHLIQAINACNRLGFFSRPGCINRARKKFCEPNKAWDQEENCPSPNSW